MHTLQNIPLTIGQTLLVEENGKITEAKFSGDSLAENWATLLLNGKTEEFIPLASQLADKPGSRVWVSEEARELSNLVDRVAQTLENWDGSTTQRLLAGWMAEARETRCHAGMLKNLPLEVKKVLEAQ